MVFELVENHEVVLEVLKRVIYQLDVITDEMEFVKKLVYDSCGGRRWRYGVFGDMIDVSSSLFQQGYSISSLRNCALQ